MAADPRPAPPMAAHALLLVAALVGWNAAAPAAVWPWPLLGPLALYGAAAAVVPPRRRPLPWLRWGRWDPANVAAAAAVSGAAAAVLYLFQALAAPDVRALAAALPLTLIGSTWLAGLVFATANAAMEEALFRGPVFDALAAERGPAVAVLATAAAFGVVHRHGYPPGGLGMVLAGIYGLALGGLRWSTGGLGLCWLAHVTADLVIFGIVVTGSPPG